MSGFDMEKRGKTWQELSKNKPYASLSFGLVTTEFSPETIREWRERRQTASLPSSLDDFYRTHGYCTKCSSRGINPHAVDRDGETLLFEDCEDCNGTGRIIEPSIETNHLEQP